MFFLLRVRFKFSSIFFFLVQYSLKKVTQSPLTYNLWPLTICHFQQTVQKFGNLDILSHYIQKSKEGGGGGCNGIFFLSCQNFPFLRFFLKASKMIFDQKNEGFLSSCFRTDEEIFLVLNPSEKDRKKQCFLILSLLSHNLTGKLSFSLKRVSKASNLIACCF